MFSVSVVTVGFFYIIPLLLVYHWQTCDLETKDLGLESTRDQFMSHGLGLQTQVSRSWSEFRDQVSKSWSQNPDIKVLVSRSFIKY